MADTGVKPQVINNDSIPFIKGSTVDILRRLYQTQIGMNAKPDDRIIILDIKAASARQQLQTTTTLASTRDTIDAGIAKFTPENFKTHGVSYKQRNTDISNSMTQLTESHEKLIQEFKQIKSHQEKIRSSFNSGKEGTGPSNEEIQQLNKETTKFTKAVQDYNDTYLSIKIKLERLSDEVSKLAPGTKKGESGPTPTLS
jgi:uncharacterized phage infection (PIP) family protein YhgE